MRTPTLHCAAGLALCLAPALVGAESSLTSGARTASVGAIARIDFRIIIPNVLGLTVVDPGEPDAKGATVRVTGNGRQVSMSANATSPSDSPANAATAPRAYSGRVEAAVLRAPRHGVVQQYADCSVGRPRVVAGGARRAAPAVVDLAPLYCTASTP